MIMQNMWFGIGYISGVIGLGDIISVGYYKVRHADSDFITSALAGGIPTLIVTISMYSLLVRDLVRAALPGRARLSVMILVLVTLAAAPLHSSTSWVLN